MLKGLPLCCMQAGNHAEFRRSQWKVTVLISAAMQFSQKLQRGNLCHFFHFTDGRKYDLKEEKKGQ